MLHGLRYFINNPNQVINPYVLLIHIGTGFIALILGPLQFWNGFRNKFLPIHRWMGRIYLTAVGISSIIGLYMGITTTHGIVFGSGMTMLALVWLFTGCMAFLSIKKGKIEEHKNWMIRNYVITFAFVSYRIGTDFMLQWGFQFSDTMIMSWLCWAPQLLIVDFWIQLRTTKLFHKRKSRGPVKELVQ